MSLDSVTIPNYTRKQETFNAISHSLGILIAIFVFVFGLVEYVNKLIPLWHLFGLTIFAVTTLMVYFISAFYHYLDKDNKYKKLLRILDHCTIYLLIAGTYTPICFVIYQEHIIGLIMLIIEWSGAIIGIILNAFFFNNKAAKIISFILYIIMGWLALYSGGFLHMDKLVFLFILLGGIAYTIGSILYAIGHKKPIYHSIFHVFVLVSTIIQCIGVLLLIR